MAGARRDLIQPGVALGVFAGVSFALVVYAFGFAGEGLACSDGLERGVFLATMGLLLAALWAVGANVVMVLATAVLAIAAAVSLDVADVLFIGVYFAVMLTLCAMVVVPTLVLLQSISFRTGVIVAGWASVWAAVPGSFVVMGACGSLGL